MTNTRPVLNLTSALAEVRNAAGNVIGKAFLIAPWNSFFQQFVQQAPAVVDATSLGSPYIANQNGTVILSGVSAVSLRRGQDITILNLVANQVIVPISIGDELIWSPGGTPRIKFYGA